jgi:hypothetical protein
MSDFIRASTYINDGLLIFAKTNNRTKWRYRTNIYSKWLNIGCRRQALEMLDNYTSIITPPKATTIIAESTHVLPIIPICKTVPIFYRSEYESSSDSDSDSNSNSDSPLYRYENGDNIHKNYNSRYLDNYYLVITRIFNGIIHDGYCSDSYNVESNQKRVKVIKMCLFDTDFIDTNVLKNNNKYIFTGNKNSISNFFHKIKNIYYKTSYEIYDILEFCDYKGSQCNCNYRSKMIFGFDVKKSGDFVILQ